MKTQFRYVVLRQHHARTRTKTCMCPFAHIYADATDAPQPEGYEEDEKDEVLSVFFSFQWRMKLAGEKPVPVRHCPPQIPRGPTRNRTRASAVRGRRLAARVTARSCFSVTYRYGILENGRAFDEIEA